MVTAERKRCLIYGMAAVRLIKMKPEKKYDIAVIGCGFAGLASAIEAAEAGASVIIIDKMNAPGGNSIISDGGIAAAGTEEQKKAGITDSPEIFFSDLMKAGLGINHPLLVKTVADNSRSAFEWLKYHIGVKFIDRIEIFGGHSVPRCFAAEGISGAPVIRKLLEKAGTLDIEIKTRAFFTGFLAGPDGETCGIKVKNNYDFKSGKAGEEEAIKTGKGVVIASGGFGADTAFRAYQDPRLGEQTGTTNQPSATAECICTAIRSGACPVQLSQIQLGPWASPDEKGYGAGPAFSEYVVFQRGIVVDPRTGKRIANELADRKTLSDALLATGGPCTGIADSSALKKSGWDISRALSKKVVMEFGSLEELSLFYGIDPDQLALTVNRFNSFTRERRDPDFGKLIIETADEIKHPPFFGIRLWPKVHYTMGGLLIDCSARVLSMEGKPLKNLYAAGEVTGGVHGASRLGSCSITDCIVFGRIAGKSAAGNTGS